MRRFWMEWLIIVALVVVSGCSDPDTASKSKDEGDLDDDAALSDIVDDTAPADSDAAGDGDGCVCSQVSACCDGCNALGVGEPCDDGLECTLDTTCQNNGTCAGSTGTPCDAQMTEPQCQAASCDEVAGCVVENAREGFECDDGDDDTFGDVCASGICQGEPCKCSGESACCDGCKIIAADGDTCDDGNASTGRDTCQGGACVGEVCECDTTTNPCCDGCMWLPGATCDTYERPDCSSSTCGGELVTKRKVKRCEPSPGGYVCGQDWSDWEIISSTSCAQNESCVADSQGVRCESSCP